MNFNFGYTEVKAIKNEAGERDVEVLVQVRDIDNKARLSKVFRVKRDLQFKE